MKIDSHSVVAITGASRGIGRAAAIEFARRGAKIVLLSRDEERMKEVSERVKEASGEALILRCDVGQEQECKSWPSKVIERFGRIDVLVNNAGYGHYAAVEELKTDDLQKIFSTNLLGSIWCTQAVIPQMKKQGAGHIVNVSTVISKRSMPYMTAYCMTKFAMNAFDEGLRLELRKNKIRVSLVCPGLTVTDFQTNAKSSGYKPPARSARGMSAERVGRAVVRAVLCNRRRIDLTFTGKVLINLNKVSPWLVDEILSRVIHP